MSTPRPQPLRDAAVDITSTRGAWMGLLTTLVSGGAIGLSTGSWLTALVGLVPGFLALTSTFAGAHGVATAGEPKVTPIADPKMVIDNQLVPLVPAGSDPPCPSH